MEITFDQLRAFCAVTDEQGYQNAAKALHKSHSSIVYAVGKLEDQCGFPLFDPQAYRSTLTPRGRRVYEKSREVLASSLDLSALCQSLSEGWEPTLRVIYDGVLPTDPYLKILTLFRSQKIPTQVQVVSDFLQGVEQQMDALKAQIMVTIVPTLGKGLTLVPLRPIKSVLVAHRDHPVHSQSKAWTLAELQKFNFLTVRGANADLRLGTRELEAGSSFHLSDFSFKKDALLKKAGLGWMPEWMIHRELERGVLKKIKWERSSEQFLRPQIAYRKEVSKGRAFQTVLKILKDSGSTLNS